MLCVSKRSEKMSLNLRELLFFLVFGLFLVSISSGSPTDKPVPAENDQKSSSASLVRISKKMCREYNHKIYDSIIDCRAPDLSCSEHCGITENSTESGNAMIGEIPHMALVGFKVKNKMQYVCGGSLISEDFVLTAAYCVAEESKRHTFLVRLGGIHLEDTPTESTQLIEVDNIHLHPKFVVGEAYNDIALLHLGKTAEIYSSVRPICLHTGRPVKSVVLMASGWGVELESGNRTDLRKIRLRETPYEVCKVPYDVKKTYGTVIKNGIDNDTMICATHPLGRDHLCFGDGGGPLVIRSEDIYCSYELVGIVGFGAACKKIQDVPSVFTRVASYIDWIEDTAWPEK